MIEPTLIEYIAKNCERLDNLKEKAHIELLEYIHLYESARDIEAALSPAIHFFTDIFNNYLPLNSFSFKVSWSEESPAFATLLSISTHFEQYTESQWDKALQEELIIYESLESDLEFIDLDIWPALLSVFSQRELNTFERHNYLQDLTLNNLLSHSQLAIYNAVCFYEKNKLESLIHARATTIKHKI